MGKKKPKLLSTPTNEKVPKVAINPDNYLSTYPSWNFSLCDTEHEKWKIGAIELDEDLLDKLKSFEKITWGDLMRASGGRSYGTNHHFIKIEDLVREAQLRLENLKIMEDSLFSIRLNGQSRLFGILRSGIFSLLWLDRNHEICISKKKHT